MEIRNIRSFVKVAECGSFTKAAKELGYAQSTITMQMQQLENELHINLFNRNGKKLSLSDCGLEFLQYAYQIIKYETMAVDHFKLSNEPEGTLKIGVMETICSSDYSMLFQHFSHLYPKVSLTIQIVTSHQAIELLEKGFYDVIFLLDNKLHKSDFVTVRKYPTDISFFCSSSHPFVHEKELSLDSLIQEPFILTEKGCNYRDIFEKELVARDLTLNCITEIGYTKYIIDAVTKQLGIGLLPAYALKNALANGEISLIKLPDYQIQMYIQVIYSNKRPVTPSLHAFLKTLQSSYDFN